MNLAKEGGGLNKASCTFTILLQNKKSPPPPFIREKKEAKNITKNSAEGILSNYKNCEGFSEN